MDLSGIILGIELFWTIVLVPIWQEIVFRYLPYKFWYSSKRNFLFVGTVTSIIFALIHWYLGMWFVVLAFLFGFIYWIAMVKYGLVVAILSHAIVNIIDFIFGIRYILAGV